MCRQSTSGLMGEADNVSLHQLSVQQVYVCTAGCGLSVICRFVAVSVFHRLTLFHTRCDGNEGHETTESQVDPQQDFVEVAGNGVGVVLVHEGEGHSGDGVEEQGGAHHRQVPALVFCCSSQPERTDDRQSLTDFIFKCDGVPLHEWLFHFEFGETRKLVGKWHPIITPGFIFNWEFIPALLFYLLTLKTTDLYCFDWTHHTWTVSLPKQSWALSH